MTHQRVFEVDGADPFAAGFHEIFGTVNDFDEAFVVHGGDVAGFEPAVFGPAMGLIWRIVVAGGDPRTAHFKFAGGFAIARGYDVCSFRAVGARDAQLDKRSGPALFSADFVAVVFGPVEHVAFEAADGGEGCGFRHAPEVHDLEIVFIEGAHEADGRGGATDHQAYGRGKFPAAGIFLEGVEHAEPDRGDTTGDGDMFLLDEIEHAFRIDVGSREDQTRAGHDAGVRQAPGVGVKHGSDGEDRVVMADGKAIGHGLGKRMQDDSAVRVDDAFGETGGAGGEAHGGAVVFVELGVLEIVIGFGEELLVVQKAFGDFAAAVGSDDHTLEGRVFAEFFVGGQKNVVDQEKAIAGVIGNAGNFVGMEPQV